ncbi:hypothetical protein ACHAXA_007765 [Cyclostephanos tholiformis]|uniref:Uncharacterized protein n=1 Tax=Cyclostephanos tholiformis TaxID=382380 RepID=A0ABD3RAL7_9STRA
MGPGMLPRFHGHALHVAPRPRRGRQSRPRMAPVGYDDMRAPVIRALSHQVHKRRQRADGGRNENLLAVSIAAMATISSNTADVAASTYCVRRRREEEGGGGGGGGKWRELRHRKCLGRAKSFMSCHGALYYHDISA